MAERPDEHAQDYGLSRDVAADLEAEEGPPSQGHHGETRTNLAGHADRQGQGPKTRRKTKEIINRQDRPRPHEGTRPAPNALSRTEKESLTC